MVKIKTVATQLPPYSRTTKEIIPYVKAWLTGQEERFQRKVVKIIGNAGICLLYTSPSPRDATLSRMPSSA